MSPTFVLAATVLVVLAPAMGSFLGVLVDRLPRGEDVIKQRSACRSCQSSLGPLELVPILSFIWQGGRCRRCRAVLPAWHLYLELTCLGIAGLSLAAGGDAWTIWGNALFLWILLGLFTADLLWFRLPDVLTGALAVVALFLAEVPGGVGLHMAVLGGVLGPACFWALRLGYKALRGREGLGLGDVKLMVGLGAFAGPFALPHLLLIASLGGLAVTLFLGLLRGAGLPKGGMAIPFGAALCAGACLLWIWRAALIG